MKRLAPWVTTILFLVTALLGGSGCDDPTDPLACSGGGRIEGRVSVGGPPEESMLRIRQVTGDGGLSTIFEVEPDEQGWYGLDVPEGRYTLELRPTSSWSGRYHYSADGLLFGQADPDTLAITAAVSPVVVDFHLGGLAVGVDVSTLLEGEECTMVLTLRDAPEMDRTPSYTREGETRVAQGRADFLLPGVLPGEYRIELFVGSRGYSYSYPREGEHFWMPGVRDEESAPWYPVAADSVTTLTAAIEGDPALIEGRVIGAWKDFGLTDAPSLSMFTPDSTMVMGLLKVNHDGEFSVPIILPEPVKLLVSQKGVDQWIGGPGFAEATVFDLQPGQTISDVELDQCGLRLDARVDKLDLDFWGSRILLYDPADLSLIAGASWSDGPDNLVGIPNLWPGDYLLHFTPDDGQLGDLWWRPQWYDRAAEPALAQTVTIGSAGEIVSLGVTLEQGGTVSGTIEGGEAADYYRSVFLAPADGNVSWGFDYLFYDRREFNLIGLPDGDYRIGVTPSGTIAHHGEEAPEGTIWYPGTTEWSEATVIEIRDGGEVTDLVIPMD